MAHYFGHYRRVVWLARSRTSSLGEEPRAVAAMFGLPLTITDTALLEREPGRPPLAPTPGGGVEVSQQGVLCGTTVTRTVPASALLRTSNRSAPGGETMLPPLTQAW